ncbi:hypothetical protein V2S66_17115 [Streptomyces sp. V4-01]|uniref:DNA-3-methyladenine glycosylase 2 family protein n=1 Tax=Actinacidiphila polyblastidii TaxID=3110430 RepID=A0ABU7PCZ1_9ACTN|nr:hypothetical protein [Streptomyces sp. V4-01]
MSTTTLLTDHPAWIVRPDGTSCRLAVDGEDAVLLTWDGGRLHSLRVGGDDRQAVAPVETGAGSLPPAAPSALTAALAQLGSVQRVPSPTLWEAITSGLLRRIVRDRRARALYQLWITAYGPAWSTPAGLMHTVPGPRTVLDLTDDAFTRVAATLQTRKALPAAAAAYLKHADTWGRLPGDHLMHALRDVPGLGPWTAARAAADFTGDHSLYPYSDPLVRTWAAKAAPSVQLPSSAGGSRPPGAGGPPSASSFTP